MGLWRVRADVLDVPGRLAALAAAVGAGGGNVLAFEVHARAPGSVTDELVVDLPAADTPARLARRLHAAGAEAVRAVPADAHELVDLPAQLVDVAARLVVDPAALPAALATAVRADRVEIASGGPPSSPHVLVVELGGGHVAVLRRAWAPFTATEAARAGAIARFAIVLSALPPVRQWLVTLPDGREVVIRTARADDAPAVVAVHTGSPPAPELFEVVLSAVLGQQPGATVLVAVSSAGAVVGVGLALPFLAGRAVEVGVFVADAARGGGVGTALLRRLAAVARELGARELVGVARAANDAARRTWRRAGLGDNARCDGDVVELRADLTRLSAPPQPLP